MGESEMHSSALKGRKVFIFHMPSVYQEVGNGQPYTSYHELFERIEKVSASVAGEVYRETERLRFNKMQDVAGITVVVDETGGTWAWAVCRKPDQFSRKFGRLLALNNQPLLTLFQ